MKLQEIESVIHTAPLVAVISERGERLDSNPNTLRIGICIILVRLCNDLHIQPNAELDIPGVDFVDDVLVWNHGVFRDWIETQRAALA